MSKETLVFEVSDSSYGKYVLLNSYKLPVLMAFVGVWSEHCFSLTSLFTTLAEEFAEQFVFASIDIDENTEARDKYEIKNVPTLVVFRDGEPVRREEGVLTLEEARALLKDFGIYRESDDMRSRARQLHMSGETPQAITMLAEAMKSDPTNTRIALDMVQIFIDIGQPEEANDLLQRLPEQDREGEVGRGLKGQLWVIAQAAKTEGVDKLAQRITSNTDDYDARFDMALCELARHDINEAMTHLFYIQQHEPDYKEGAAREMIVSVINTLATNDPQAAEQFRRKLSSLINQ